MYVDFSRKFALIQLRQEDIIMFFLIPAWHSEN